MPTPLLPVEETTLAYHEPCTTQERKPGSARLVLQAACVGWDPCSSSGRRWVSADMKRDADLGLTGLKATEMRWGPQPGGE